MNKYPDPLERFRLCNSRHNKKDSANYIKYQMSLRRGLLQARLKNDVEQLDKNIIRLKQSFNERFGETYENYMKSTN